MSEAHIEWSGMAWSYNLELRFHIFVDVGRLEVDCFALNVFLAEASTCWFSLSDNVGIQSCLHAGWHY